LERFGISYIYTEFPEGRIYQESIEVGSVRADALLYDLRQGGIGVDGNARRLIESMHVQAFGPEIIRTVRLRVKDLGIKDDSPLLFEVYQRANELGIVLCPPEVGPQYSLQHTDQTEGKFVYLGMESIDDIDVFAISNNVFPSLGVMTWRSPIRGVCPDVLEFLFSLPERKSLK
jgi:hypothetical protein